MPPAYFGIAFQRSATPLWMEPPLLNAFTPPFAPTIPPLDKPKKDLIELQPLLNREIPTDTDVPIQEEMELQPFFQRLTPTE